MKRIALLTAILAAACGPGVSEGPQLSVIAQDSVVPASYNCSTVTYYLGRSFGANSFVINDPAPGTYAPMDAAGDSVTLASPDNIVWSWESTALIRAIFIRADVPGTPLGDATNQVWLYVPPGDGKFSAGGIYTEDSTSQRYVAKQIEFCFDAPTPPAYALTVTKTAVPSYDKKYDWSVVKTSAAPSLTLSAGQVFGMEFTVDVSVAAVNAINAKVAGVIDITNPAPVAATITSIFDELEGAALDCGAVVLPLTLPAGGSLHCTYAADLESMADGANVVHVSTTGAVQGATATAGYGFATVVPGLVDECVVVADEHAGALGQVCAEASPATFKYLFDIGPFEACGAFGFANTATITGVDTQRQWSSTVEIPVNVPCENGCTLTPGYWKTHSKYGPAPYDDNWVNAGEDTAFFLSGTTWYGQFGISPAGNAYWQLSHQYAAAVLNAFNGASHGSVDAALADARALFLAWTPAQIGALRGSSELRAQFIALAGRLGSFNAGGIGPGHCSE